MFPIPPHLRKSQAMPTADGSEVVVVALEVTADEEALAAAAAKVKKKAKKWWKARGETGRNSKTGLLDVLINNAGACCSAAARARVCMCVCVCVCVCVCACANSFTDIQRPNR